jgi:hypothetical protein
MLRTHALNRLSPSQSDPGHPVPQPSDVMPGEEVWVDAFGLWRPGEVVKRLRTKVRVDYVRNTQGDRHVRDFPVGCIRKTRPAGLGGTPPGGRP